MTTLKVTEAKTTWEKTKGLLTSSKPYPLLLKTRWGIHTFGMRYPIDVVIVERTHIAILKENLKPNRIFLWNPKYEIVLELPSGFIRKNKLKIGTKLQLIME